MTLGVAYVNCAEYADAAGIATGAKKPIDSKDLRKTHKCCTTHQSTREYSAT